MEFKSIYLNKGDVMFQKAIKEEFSKFDFTNVNNKNEIK